MLNFKNNVKKFETEFNETVNEDLNKRKSF